MRSVTFCASGDVGKGSITLGAGKHADDDSVRIMASDKELELNFALKYLNIFAKAAGLANEARFARAPRTPV